jgi:hypothetical protein
MTFLFYLIMEANTQIVKKKYMRNWDFVRIYDKGKSSFALNFGKYFPSRGL